MYSKTGLLIGLEETLEYLFQFILGFSHPLQTIFELISRRKRLYQLK